MANSGTFTGRSPISKVRRPVTQSRRLLISVLATALVACTGNNLAPVEDGAVRTLREPSAQVVSGDTLYSFAWRYGFDYREIARWNELRAPYTIRAGQRLRLVPPAEYTARSDSSAAAVSVAKTTPAAAPTAISAATRSIPQPRPSPPVQPESSPGPEVQQITASAAAPAITTTSAKPNVAAPNEWTLPKQAPSSWLWPLQNAKVVAGFDPKRPGGRGLDLQAPPGSKVRASAAGKVVYEGSGLPGYGRLIILKHTESLLSAYGHLGGFHVKEGDIVESGEVLADLSAGGGNDPSVLRFEIRQDGQPKNPLAFLPS